ncbi:MAG: hypothetical protein ACT4O1_13755 [Gemmatimonadota bacterium]
MNTNKLLLLLLACLCATPVAAQEPRLEWAAAGRSAPMLMLGLKPADALFPIGLAVSRPPSLATRLRFTEWTGLRLAATQMAETASPDSISFLPPLPLKLSKAARDTTAGEAGILSGTLGEHADIGMLVRGRGDLGGAWTRYTPCDPGLQITCEPGLFPQLRPDIQFGVMVGGTISDRIHVNVDYDQTREFDAANNINVYYQGFEDEILQRLEVGDVSIRLPPSRYLTQGIPAGNFGFKATGQLGPVAFQTVFAQQRGDVTSREFRLAGAGNSRGLVQDETLSIDDADYVKGQFFFIVDPDLITGAPHVDVLTLRASDAPADKRPGIETLIEVYRDERPSALNQQQQAQLGYFLGDAAMPDGSRTHRGLFKRLEPDKDYVLHPSGLWIMLRGPLRADEALAVSYVTESGDTVGTLNAEATPAGSTPMLQLVRGPAAIHQPNFATWKYELHNVYRVHSSSSVDPANVNLTISLGQASSGSSFANTIVGPQPYLRLFGLDEDAPTDALDAAQIFQPGRQLGGGSTFTSGAPAIGGTYLILPTLRPFFEPAPVTSIGLSAADAKLALGSNANSTIYDDVDPTAREGSTRFRLNFAYRVAIEGLVSSFNLGAFGIREASERIQVGSKILQAGVDYNIDYEIGMVTLTDPQTLFATEPDAEIRATWEQKSEFQLAATSVFGMNARYQMGPRGELNFVGLYQNEKTIMTRPQLGVEPSAIFLGGTSARLDLGGALLERALSKLPGLRLGGTSSVTFTGEAAVSMPNPNTRNEAYVDDFEAADGTNLDLRRRSWRLGSRPEALDGASEYLPAALGPDNAVRLVWQHDVLDRNGQPVGGELPQNIDRTIQIAGTPLRENTMWLTLGDTAQSKFGRRWRSMTAVLSTTGVDMSRSEYLEFYVSTGDGLGKAFIIDIGSVSEDGFYFDEQGRTTGTYPDGAPWGAGFLDEEAQLAAREIWSTDKDARGLYNESCQGVTSTSPALGSPSANCARDNGLPDTEDLDGNGILDPQDGSYFRYVVPLGPNSPYLVRDRNATQTLYQLYRIPLRGGMPVNGATTTSWRFVKHLRLIATSATTQPIDQFLVARLRIVGSRWVKREVEGVMKGLLSDQKGLSAASATVVVSPVSRLTNAGDYSSPPFVLERLQDPSQGIGAGTEEFNEKGLAITYNALAPAERADVYFRYTQQPRSFLTYRQMQLWAVAKTGNFGPAGNQKLVVKVGTDARNYYLYQTKLRAAPTSGVVIPNDWLPQLAIDFEQWFDLKAKAELALLRGELTRPSPNEPYVIFSADSTYGIVFEDRARAPNLAAVRELSFGVYNGSTNSEGGEVWLNDIRLASAFRDPGVAGNLSIDVRGGDFLAANVTYANQGAVFRQLNQDASFLGTGDLTLSTTAQLGQMLPASWGVELPVTVAHVKNAMDPTLLQSSDVEAARLPGLRETGSSVTRFGLSLRKRTPSDNAIVSALVDPLSLRMSYNTGTTSAITLRNEASGLDGTLSYMRDVKYRDVDFMPSFIEAALRVLAPRSVESSEFFKRLTGARLRYTPVRLQFSTSYLGQERSAYQFTSILVSDSDAVIIPIESPRRALDSDAVLAFQPFNSLTGNIALRTSRDLLPAQRASNQNLTRSAIDAARSNLAGVDVGWETNRSVTTQLGLRPQVAAWLNPSATLSTRFGTDRSTSYLEVITVGADSTALLQRRFQADRQLRRQLDFAPAGFYQTIVKDTTGFAGTIGRALKVVQPISLIWSSSLGSQFDRNATTPALAYQLALGDLERFRFMGVDSAAAATETGRFDASTSLRLLRSAQLDLQYASSDLQAFDQRGGSRRETETTWPNVRLNWADVPLPGAMRGIVKLMSLTGSYLYKERDQALGQAVNADRGSRETSVPFTARLTFAGGIAAMYSGTWSTGDREDPTGDAEQSGMNHNMNMSVTFKPPQSLGEKLREPIRATIGLTQNQQQQCRFSRATASTEESTCVSFLDFRTRVLNLTLDTNISDLIVGLQMGYNSRQDFVGMRRGNSQFQLGIFANFELPVGQLPNMNTDGLGGGIR